MGVTWRTRVCSYHTGLGAITGDYSLHGVHADTCHFRHFATGLVLTVTQSPWNGPLTICVDGPLTAIQRLPIGSRAVLKQDAFTAGNVTVELTAGAAWDPPANRPASAGPRTAYRWPHDLHSLTSEPGVLGAAAALATGTRTGRLQINEMWERRLWERGQATVQACLAERWPELEQQIRGLVGLGPGLTPTGDDLLCGILIAFASAGVTALWSDRSLTALRQATECINPAATTALGRTWLMYASRGVAVEPLLQLVDSWRTWRRVSHLKDLLAVGHSTGRHLLAGALLVWSAVLEKGRVDATALGRPA